MHLYVTTSPSLYRKVPFVGFVYSVLFINGTGGWSSQYVGSKHDGNAWYSSSIPSLDRSTLNFLVFPVTSKNI